MAAWAVDALLGALAVVALLNHAQFAAGVLAILSATLIAWLLMESTAIAGIVADAAEHADETATAIGRPQRRRPTIR